MQYTNNCAVLLLRCRFMGRRGGRCWVCSVRTDEAWKWTFLLPQFEHCTYSCTATPFIDWTLIWVIPLKKYLISHLTKLTILLATYLAGLIRRSIILKIFRDKKKARLMRRKIRYVSGVPRGVGWGVQPPPPRNSEVLTKSNRLQIERKIFSVPIPTS